MQPISNCSPVTLPTFSGVQSLRKLSQEICKTPLNGKEKQVIIYTANQVFAQGEGTEEEVLDLLPNLVELFETDVKNALNCISFFEYFQKKRVSWLLGHEISHPSLKSIHQWCRAFTICALIANERSKVISSYYLNYLIATSTLQETQKLLITYMAHQEQSQCLDGLSGSVKNNKLLLDWFLNNPKEIAKNPRDFSNACQVIFLGISNNTAVNNSFFSNKILKLYAFVIVSKISEIEKINLLLNNFSDIDQFIKRADIADCINAISKLKNFYDNCSSSIKKDIGALLFSQVDIFFERINNDEIRTSETIAFAGRIAKSLLLLHEEQEDLGKLTKDNEGQYQRQTLFKKATIRALQHVQDLANLDENDHVQKNHPAKKRGQTNAYSQCLLEQKSFKFLFTGENASISGLKLIVLFSLKHTRKKRQYENFLKNIINEKSEVFKGFKDCSDYIYFFSNAENRLFFKLAPPNFYDSQSFAERYATHEQCIDIFERGMKPLKKDQYTYDDYRFICVLFINALYLLNNINCPATHFQLIFTAISHLLEMDCYRIIFKNIFQHYNEKLSWFCRQFLKSYLSGDNKNTKFFIHVFNESYEIKKKENSHPSVSYNWFYLLSNKCKPQKNEEIPNLQYFLSASCDCIALLVDDYILGGNRRLITYAHRQMNDLLEVYENCFADEVCTNQFMQDVNKIFCLLTGKICEITSEFFLINRFYVLVSKLKNTDSFLFLCSLVIENFVVNHHPIKNKDIDFLLKCVQEHKFITDRKVVEASELPAILLHKFNQLEKNSRAYNKLLTVLEYFLSDHLTLIKVLKGENLEYEAWAKEKIRVLNEKMMKCRSSLQTSESNTSHPYEAQKIVLHNNYLQLKIKEIENLVELFVSQENCFRSLNTTSLENKWKELYSGLKKVTHDAKQSFEINLAKLEQKKIVEKQLAVTVSNMEQNASLTFASLSTLNDQCQKNIREIHASAIAHLYTQDVEAFKFNEWENRLNQVLQAVFQSMSVFVNLFQQQQIEIQQLKSEITHLKSQNQEMQDQNNKVTKKLTKKITWLKTQLPIKEQSLDVVPMSKVGDLSIEECLNVLQNKKLSKAYVNFSNNQSKNELAQLLNAAGFVEADPQKSKSGTSHKQMRFKTKEGHNLEGTSTTISAHNEDLCLKSINEALECFKTALNYQVKELGNVS